MNKLCDSSAPVNLEKYYKSCVNYPEALEPELFGEKNNTLQREHESEADRERERKIL